jgi:hypothetical protein
LEVYAAVCRKCGYQETSLRSGGESGTGTIGCEDEDDDDLRDPLYACEACRRAFFVHRRRPSADEVTLELRELEDAATSFGPKDPRGRLAIKRRAVREKLAPDPEARTARCSHCRGSSVRLLAVSEVRARPPACPACASETLEIVLRGFHA